MKTKYLPQWIELLYFKRTQRPPMRYRIARVCAKEVQDLLKRSRMSNIQRRLRNESSCLLMRQLQLIIRSIINIQCTYYDLNEIIMKIFFVGDFQSENCLLTQLPREKCTITYVIYPRKCTSFVRRGHALLNVRSCSFTENFHIYTGHLRFNRCMVKLLPKHIINATTVNL